MEKSVSYLFPTPIGEFQFPDTGATDRELETLILAKEQTEPSEHYANAGGWHSRQDLLEWPHAGVRQLRTWIMEAVNHMISVSFQLTRSSVAPGGALRAKAWANVSRRGHYHRMHNHPGSAWSGVYYVNPGVDAPAHPLSGVLELPDPRPHANMVATPGDPFAQKALIRPKAGLIVVFPGWFQHFVHPYFGDEQRVSIAFNVEVADAPPRPRP